MVAIDNKFEGAYVVRRGGYWYFFASTANCCAGPTTGYSVQVGSLAQTCAARTSTVRACRCCVAGRRDADADPERQPVDRPRPQRRRHRPVRPGLDRLPRARPRRPVPGRAPIGINERPMLIDRLDWVDGWPYRPRRARAVSEGAQPGPVTSGATSRGSTRAPAPSAPRRRVGLPDRRAVRPVRRRPRRNQSTLTAQPLRRPGKRPRGGRCPRLGAAITLGRASDRTAGPGLGGRPVRPLRAQVPGGRGGPARAPRCRPNYKPERVALARGRGARRSACTPS